MESKEKGKNTITPGEKKPEKAEVSMIEADKTTQHDTLTPIPAPETEDQKKQREDQERTKFKKELFISTYIATLGSVKATAEKVGIHRDRFYEWMKNDPVFAETIRTKVRERLEDVEAKLNKLILEEDGPSIRFFLEKRHPLYKPRIKIDGPVNGEAGAEDDADKFFADIISNDEPKKDEPGLHRAEVPDPQQAGNTGAIQAQ